MNKDYLIEAANRALLGVGEDDKRADPELFGFIPVETAEEAAEYSQGTEWDLREKKWFDHYVDRGYKFYYKGDAYAHRSATGKGIKLMWAHKADSPQDDLIHDEHNGWHSPIEFNYAGMP